MALAAVAATLYKIWSVRNKAWWEQKVATTGSCEGDSVHCEAKDWRHYWEEDP